MRGLRGKVAVVTGGARGIGLATLERLGEEGCRLVVADVDVPAAEKAAAGLAAGGAEALAVGVDVTDEASVAAMVEAVRARFGRVDVLVNNAGIYPVADWWEISAEEWDRVQSVDLRGTFLVSRAVFPLMRAQGGGRIVNISTGGVLRGRARLAHYVAAKAGVIGLTRVMARESGRFGIRVNAVMPGYVETDTARGMWDAATLQSILTGQSLSHRYLVPEDIAAAVTFLVSDDSAMVSGQVLNVDGGTSMP